jgi:hypothetical protein
LQLIPEHSFIALIQWASSQLIVDVKKYCFVNVCPFQFGERSNSSNG